MPSYVNPTYTSMYSPSVDAFLRPSSASASCFLRLCFLAIETRSWLSPSVDRCLIVLTTALHRMPTDRCLSCTRIELNKPSLLGDPPTPLFARQDLPPPPLPPAPRPLIGQERTEEKSRQRKYLRMLTLTPPRQVYVACSRDVAGPAASVPCRRPGAGGAGEADCRQHRHSHHFKLSN